MQGIVTGLICTTVFQSYRVQSWQRSVNSWYRIQWRSWTECRVQNNITLHLEFIDERATDGSFHEVSMQNRRTCWRSWVNSLQSWVEHFEFDPTRKMLSLTYQNRLSLMYKNSFSLTYTRTVWVRHTRTVWVRCLKNSRVHRKFAEQFRRLAKTQSPSTRKQEKTQLVKAYDRTYYWHITMVRVCHINSQNTAHKPNYNNYCNTP